MNDKDPLTFLEPADSPLNNRQVTIRNCRIIIKIRWFASPFVFLIMLISSAIGLSIEKGFSIIPVLANTSIILGLNLLYRLLLPRLKRLRLLVYLQLFIDALHISFNVYNTGGITSPFTFLYFLVIVASAILISGAATNFCALLVTILYSTIVTLEIFGILPHQDYFIPLSGLYNAPSYITLSWLFNMASFFSVAFLVSYLFAEIRQRQSLFKRANHSYNKKIKTLLFLFDTSAALNTHRTVKQVVDYILSELLEFLNLDRALLYLVVNKSYLKLYMLKHRNPDSAVGSELNLQIPLKEEAGLTAITAIKKQAVNVKCQMDSKLINRKLAQVVGTNPFAMAPLVVREQTIGVLGIDRRIKNGTINNEEFQILKLFANQAAIALRSMLKGNITEKLFKK